MGAASQLRMDAMRSSLIIGYLRRRGDERQLGHPLSSDRRGDFRTEPGRFAAQRTDHVGRWTVSRNDDMHQQSPTIRRRRNVIDEQIAEVILAVAICEREI